jgi:hypothetical protein
MQISMPPVIPPEEIEGTKSSGSVYRLCYASHMFVGKRQKQTHQRQCLSMLCLTSPGPPFSQLNVSFHNLSKGNCFVTLVNDEEEDQERRF